METRPDGQEASILVCWNPEMGPPNQKVIDGLSRFIGSHYLLIDPITGHTNVIPMDRFHEAGGKVGAGQKIDESAMRRINESMTNPDLN